MGDKKFGTKILYRPKGRAGEYCAWAVNLFKGCDHGCLYCYAPDATFTSWENFRKDPQARRNILEDLRKDCEKVSGRIDSPIFLCFTSDPYQAIEKDLEITRQAIHILHKAGLSVKILTKAGSLPRRDFDILSEKDYFGSTLTFTDPDHSLKWEPHADPPSVRLDALREAHDRGIRTWVSLEPVIDPGQTLALIEMCAPFVDEFRVGMLNHIQNAQDRGWPWIPEIDWKEFGKTAENLLIALEKNHVLKRDLRAEMRKS